MRFLPILVCAAVSLGAQSPLTTTFADNNGGAAGGAVYFDLECLEQNGLTITGIELNFQGAGGDAGNVEVFMKAGTWDPITDPWTLITTGTVAATSPGGTPTPVTLADPIELGPGCKVGVAIVTDVLAHAYTTATTLPPTVATAELELTVGGGSNVPFSAPVFSPRLVNINIAYDSGGSCPSLPVFASAVPQGDGCVSGNESFYEVQAAGTNDLVGMKLNGFRNGNGFDLSTQAGLGFVPGGSATALTIGDDDAVDTSTIGGTLGIWVGSNCWVAFGGGNSTDFAPSVATMLGNPSTALYSWTDLDPTAAGSGQIYYEESGTIAAITYDGVYGWGTTDQNFVQFVINTATGGFTIEWGAVGAGNPEDLLVGYSIGGASADPGPTDISAGPFSIELPLSLSGAAPIQGASAYQYEVTTGNIPSGALSHMGLLGFSRPGLPLDGIGMPGCFLNASADILVFEVFPMATPQEWTWSALTIPAIGAQPLLGETFNLQGVIFGTSANGFINLGAQTSNGLKCTIGDL